MSGISTAPLSGNLCIFHRRVYEGTPIAQDGLSAGEGRVQKKKKGKNPEQQVCSEKAVRSLKHIQTTALEIKLKNLVTSGSLRRSLLFPSCKALGMLLAAHGGLWKSRKDDAVVSKQHLAASFPLNAITRLWQLSIGEHETQIILHRS